MSEQKQKIGAGHLAAMGRAGLKELAQVLPAFPGQGVHGIEEPGLAGNLTPQEVVNAKGAAETYEQHLFGFAQRGQQQEQRTAQMER